MAIYRHHVHTVLRKSRKGNFLYSFKNTYGSQTLSSEMFQVSLVEECFTGQRKNMEVYSENNLNLERGDIGEKLDTTWWNLAPRSSRGSAGYGLLSFYLPSVIIVSATKKRLSWKIS